VINNIFSDAQIEEVRQSMVMGKMIQFDVEARRRLKAGMEALARSVIVILEAKVFSGMLAKAMLILALLVLVIFAVSVLLFFVTRD
jgi:hypothetical protein